MTNETSQVAIIMGSDSDLPIVEAAFPILDSFGIKKSAPKVKGYIVRDAMSKADLIVAMSSVQKQLLLEGTVKEEAAIMADEWIQTNDGRTKVLSTAREDAGIGPRFSAPVTPPSKGQWPRRFLAIRSNQIHAASETY